MKQTLKKYLFLFLLVPFASWLTSCSAVTRPPAAAAYMDSYNKDKVTMSIAASYYAGDLERSHASDYGATSEWWGDVHLRRFISSGYFTFGWGTQFYTPFLQSGFVSPYFGLTGWANLWSLTVLPISKFNENNNGDEQSFLDHYSGGGMIIEQIPLNDTWKLGFTQHISRNGRENTTYGNFFNSNLRIIPSPHPVFYTEVGGGFYASRQIKEDSKISFEFRYGRDLDEKRNRFAFTVDYWFSAAPIPYGGNDIMRKYAEKNIEKMKHMNTLAKDSISKAQTNSLASADTLHTIKRQWFRLPDSSQTLSNIYAPQKKVVAVTSKEICYSEETQSVWLKQDVGNLYYQVSEDSIDYCGPAEPKSIAAVPVLEGGLFSLIGYQLTSNPGASLALGTVAAIGSWGIFKFGFKPNELQPIVYPNLCSEKHSKEDLIKWLKQYPCSGKIKDIRIKDIKIKDEK
jgi:hypothetical protein